MTIISGFEKINQIINACITREMVQDGLLEDVETFVNTYYDEGTVEEPVIWVTQHPTTVNKQPDISQTTELNTPFEFDCGVYAVDIEESNMQSQNLANRVILAILKNWLTVEQEVLGKRRIRNITLETYSPIGYVPIENKSDKLAMTGVILNVNHVINWSLCCKQLNNGE